MKSLKGLLIASSVILCSVCLFWNGYTENETKTSSMPDISTMKNISHIAELSYDDFIVVDAKMDYDGVFEITFIDEKDYQKYTSDYITTELRDLVCHIGNYADVTIQRHYDCSTKEKIIQAMTQELLIQTGEIIREGI